jgi:hypothetical protein
MPSRAFYLNKNKNNMKILLILITALIFSPLFLLAQSSDPELDYIKKSYSKDKKTIVDEYMGLDAQQGTKFWPVYGEYESKREKLALERLKLIEDYIDGSDNISASQADKTASAVLANNINLGKLNLEYYGKLKTAVGAIKAAKFIQLETYLQTAWRMFVQDNIPLISELDKTKQH